VTSRPAARAAGLPPRAPPHSAGDWPSPHTAMRSRTRRGRLSRAPGGARGCARAGRSRGVRGGGRRARDHRGFAPRAPSSTAGGGPRPSFLRAPVGSSSGCPGTPRSRCRQRRARRRPSRDRRFPAGQGAARRPRAREPSCASRLLVGAHGRRRSSNRTGRARAGHSRARSPPSCATSVPRRSGPRTRPSPSCSRSVAGTARRSRRSAWRPARSSPGHRASRAR